MSDIRTSHGAAAGALSSREYHLAHEPHPENGTLLGFWLYLMSDCLIFAVLFALARTVGWIAQWKEMIEDPSQKIGRPRQLYTGEKRRDYVPMSKR